MTIHPLQKAPTAELAQALERFEVQFRYPLGPGRYFRISHGEDYPRFFRAMGEGICFVAERENRVLGVIGAALRRLTLPNGTEQQSLYLGDLKIDPSARGGRVLPHLAAAVRQWTGTRVTSSFAVVMDGTPVTPERYTGRLGIPSFEVLGKVMVLRLSTMGSHAMQDKEQRTSEETGTARYLQLSAGRYASPGGNPAERSEMDPLWLLAPDGEACGRLEDTRRGKRLISDDGTEMQSAHMSCFAYQDVSAGVAILRVALGFAAARGLPALFVAVAAAEAEDFRRLLEGTDPVLAPATIYGTGLEPGPLWNINTAEI
jgi:hypothetical protein